jgi:hypothetical protein
MMLWTRVNCRSGRFARVIHFAEQHPAAAERDSSPSLSGYEPADVLYGNLPAYEPHGVSRRDTHPRTHRPVR